MRNNSTTFSRIDLESSKLIGFSEILLFIRECLCFNRRIVVYGPARNPVLFSSF